MVCKEINIDVVINPKLIGEFVSVQARPIEIDFDLRDRQINFVVCTGVMIRQDVVCHGFDYDFDFDFDNCGDVAEGGFDYELDLELA